MTNYLFTIKINGLSAHGHYMQEKNYRKKIHGQIHFKDTHNETLTRKKVNWYCRNYFNVWSFIH